METKYTPEIQIYRKTCECCGDSFFEFTEVKVPYFCEGCFDKLSK